MKSKLLLAICLFSELRSGNFEININGAWIMRDDINTMGAADVNTLLSRIYGGVQAVVTDELDLTTKSDGSNSALIGMFNNAIDLTGRILQSSNTNFTASQKATVRSYNDFFNYYKVKGNWTSVPASPSGVATVVATDLASVLTDLNNRIKATATTGSAPLAISSQAHITKFFTDLDSAVSIFNSARASSDQSANQTTLVNILNSAAAHSAFWRQANQTKITNTLALVKNPLSLSAIVDVVNARLTKMTNNPDEVTREDVQFILDAINGKAADTAKGTPAQKGLSDVWFSYRTLDLPDVADSTPFLNLINRLIADTTDFSTAQIKVFGDIKTNVITGGISTADKCSGIINYLTSFESKYLASGVSQAVINSVSPFELDTFIRGIEILLGANCWDQIKSTETGAQKQVTALIRVITSAKTSTVFSADQQAKLNDYLGRINTANTSNQRPVAPGQTTTPTVTPRVTPVVNPQSNSGTSTTVTTTGTAATNSSSQNASSTTTIVKTVTTQAATASGQTSAPVTTTTAAVANTDGGLRRIVRR